MQTAVYLFKHKWFTSVIQITKKAPWPGREFKGNIINFELCHVPYNLIIQ
jgi:hypothetical protein